MTKKTNGDQTNPNRFIEYAGVHRLRLELNSGDEICIAYPRTVNIHADQGTLIKMLYSEASLEKADE